ncbi:hypothetical protein [Pseudoduganella lutea]|uniref:Uncharacterized protein n=1 Tax=Pseudoduganella lutea TaxID=321985 RepID=A0A4V0Z4C5_9BURK|nr:hypothetical protein [Pseudoduganella lutea]QBE66463.1 hypothetical protein EWM63_28735 [Pseudoduganella lutea]
MDALQERVLAELRRYAANRLKDVARGAETRELAGLLVEKYGYGLAKALAIAGELAGVPAPDLGREIERVVLEVDPDAVEHRSRRWDAASAGLSLPRRG